MHRYKTYYDFQVAFNDALMKYGGEQFANPEENLQMRTPVIEAFVANLSGALKAHILGNDEWRDKTLGELQHKADRFMSDMDLEDFHSAEAEKKGGKKVHQVTVNKGRNNDGKGKKQCDYCNRKGHESASCYKRIADEQNNKSKNPTQGAAPSQVTTAPVVYVQGPPQVITHPQSQQLPNFEPLKTFASLPYEQQVMLIGAIAQPKPHSGSGQGSPQ